MSSLLDYRSFNRPLEIRSVSKPGYLEKGLRGYAVVYNTESRDMGGFKEVIVRGAMKASLAKGLDVRLLYQHDSKQVMARETAGTLTLREDDTGVYFEADLIDKTLNREVIADVVAKNLDGMSFGMPIDSIKTKWDRGADGKTVVRNITVADFTEVSVVTWPAYTDTTLMARSLENAQAEFKSFMQQAAAGNTSGSGILRARHHLSKRRYSY